MPARLTRWHRACCRSRSEKQPRRCRSSWTDARSTVSPCAGARSATPTTPKAAPPRPARNARLPRPSARCIPRFSGLIEQVPPRFSAVKIGGERAYDLARDGEVVELAARPVEIHHIELVDTPDPDHSVLAAECGKGTYVRALARDMGRALGCFGHVTALRRTAVGPFTEQIATGLEALQAHGAARRGQYRVGRRPLLPVEAGLAALPALRVSAADAAPARPRTGRTAARARRAGHGGLGVGICPRRAGGPGAGRKGRIAPAADLQPAAGLSARNRPKPLHGRMILSGTARKSSLSHWRS